MREAPQRRTAGYRDVNAGHGSRRGGTTEARWGTRRDGWEGRPVRDYNGAVLRLVESDGEGPVRGVDLLADVFSLLDDSLPNLSPDDELLDDLRLVRDLLRPLVWRRDVARRTPALS